MSLEKMYTNTDKLDFIHRKLGRSEVHIFDRMSRLAAVRPLDQNGARHCLGLFEGFSEAHKAYCSDPASEGWTLELFTEYLSKFHTMVYVKYLLAWRVLPLNREHAAFDIEHAAADRDRLKLSADWTQFNTSLAEVLGDQEEIDCSRGELYREQKKIDCSVGAMLRVLQAAAVGGLARLEKEQECLDRKLALLQSNQAYLDSERVRLDSIERGRLNREQARQDRVNARLQREQKRLYDDWNALNGELDSAIQGCQDTAESKKDTLNVEEALLIQAEIAILDKMVENELSADNARLAAAELVAN
jgi:hypothetical protein